MCAQFDPADSRDRAIAQAVARAVRSSHSDQPCPDASLVAAYADQSLADAERAHLENHFAGCERCRQTLAALGLALEAPAVASVTVMPAPVAAPRPGKQRWLWWLSPAFGAAAAALLWMALRPAAPAPIETAANYSAPDAQEPRVQNAPAAPRNEIAPPSGGARRDAQVVDRFEKTESSAKEADARGRRQESSSLAAPSADAVAAALPPQPAPRAQAAAGAGGGIGTGTAGGLAPAAPPPPPAPRRDLQPLSGFSAPESSAIQGGVSDQTGGAIAGAKVVITDKALGVTRNLTTDNNGQYLAPDLSAGAYTVRAEATGFGALERQDVVLQAGRDTHVDLVMQPGAQTQTVTITEEIPLVNSSSATLGGTLSSQTVADLPIAARARIAQAAAQSTIYTYTFASPEGGVQWRLGAAGLIEKSADNGQTWQQQPSGVTVDLLAGSAASNQVAWIVGRAGVILRTTNGQQWQRIAAPSGITGDWVTVVVRSAASATVVGPIRRFSTEDGGLTWTEQN